TVEQPASTSFVCTLVPARRLGAFAVAKKVDCQGGPADLGRRSDPRSCLQATTPSGWKAEHRGGATSRSIFCSQSWTRGAIRPRSPARSNTQMFERRADHGRKSLRISNLGLVTGEPRAARSY